MALPQGQESSGKRLMYIPVFMEDKQRVNIKLSPSGRVFDAHDQSV
jgi:hypothetical protein